LKSNDTLAIILGGGQGSRLYPLTAFRSKPAVPIGGKYRLIDVPISGCLHADIRRIFVLTQFNSASHLRNVPPGPVLERVRRDPGRRADAG
jgi:glucose-1-phosphate adenylyltransferase